MGNWNIRGDLVNPINRKDKGAVEKHAAEVGAAAKLSAPGHPGG